MRIPNNRNVRSQKEKGRAMAGREPVRERDMNSLRARSRNSMARRKKQLRTRLILMNSAIALIIILIVLVCKVIALNKENMAADLEKGTKTANKTEQKKETGKKNTKKDVKEKKPTSTQTPVPTAQAVTGTDKWLRKDLDPNKPMVALTFDDGPYAPVTRKILSVLKKHDSKATFFCVGNRLTNYAQTVKLAYEQGCQIASHTYDHVQLTSLKKKKIKSQVAKTDKSLEKIVGCKTTALRPPGGFVDKKVRKAVDVPMVCWSIDTQDWKSRNKKKILKQCKSIRDGDIVLMHDLYPTTAAAVEKLVPKLKKKGFLLVTVDELFYYKGISPQAGKVYFSGR